MIRAIQRDLIAGITCGSILLAATERYPVDYVTACFLAIVSTYVGRGIFRLTLRWGVI